MMERRRVVITGIGSINPLALSWADTWPKLVAGESGIGPFTRFDPAELGLATRIGGEVKGFDPGNYMDARAARRMDLFAQFAVAAALEAAGNARLAIGDHNRDGIAVLLATGVGGIQTIVDEEAARINKGANRVSPYGVAALMPNAGAGQIGILLGVRGMGMSLNSACASSNDAMGMALAAVRLGWTNTVVTGGSEAALVPITVASFNQARALSTRYNDQPTRASRPFDKDRDGFVLSELATVLIFEELEHARRRGAPVLAEVVGYGASMDAYHITAPAPDGNGAVRAMRHALADAGLEPVEIDYISAHGTSTQLNDATETAAIKEVFGERAYQIPVSSLKSMVGHSAGACGALEAAAGVHILREGIIPPTINYETPDPECDLDYVPNAARQMDVHTVLSNNFGFGGHNSCIVLRKLPE
jgi:3-oxoacyl-[acyl-carrier-protein] synthase II